MKALKLVGYIIAAILIFFGILFVWSAFGTNGQPGNIVTGGITLLVGFGIIIGTYYLFRKKEQDVHQHTTNVQVNLPGDVDIERFQCADCGAQLTMDSVKMVAGAPMVECPYCNATYSLTEDPKW